MLNFRIKWLERYFKKRMKPMAPEIAEKWCKRLSIAYAFMGWQIIGIGFVILYKKELRKDVPKVEAYAQLLNLENAKVFQFAGFSKINEFELQNYKQLEDRRVALAREMREEEAKKIKDAEQSTNESITSEQPEDRRVKLAREMREEEAKKIKDAEQSANELITSENFSSSSSTTNGPFTIF